MKLQATIHGDDCGCGRRAIVVRADVEPDEEGCLVGPIEVVEPRGCVLAAHEVELAKSRLAYEWEAFEDEQDRLRRTALGEALAGVSL